jgi:hypothetical protein
MGNSRSATDYLRPGIGPTGIGRDVNLVGSDLQGRSALIPETTIVTPDSNAERVVR